MKKSELSELMGNYNRLKAFVRRTGGDTKRVDRAFGLCQTPERANEKLHEYHTTPCYCDCDDMKYYYSKNRKNQNGEQYKGKCKHMLVLELEQTVKMNHK